MKTISVISEIENFPRHFRLKVIAYANFLLGRQKENPKTTGREMSFNWEGGLSELGEKFTSVGLQHQGLKNR